MRMPTCCVSDRHAHIEAEQHLREVIGLSGILLHPISKRPLQEQQEGNRQDQHLGRCDDCLEHLIESAQQLHGLGLICAPAEETKEPLPRAADATCSRGALVIQPGPALLMEASARLVLWLIRPWWSRALRSSQAEVCC